MYNAVVTLANTIADPLPLTPTSLAGIQTVTTQKSINGCGSTVVLNDSTVASLISQQSANAYGLTAQQRIDQGIFDGVVGASLNQLTLPGQFIKPGSAQFIQAKLLEGATLEDAIGNNLLTGSMGVLTTDQLKNNVQAQTYAVSSSIDEASTALIRSNAITGQESDSEIAGLIFAAAVAGPANINDFLNTTGEIIIGVGERISGAARGITTTANNIKQLLAGGNFASKIADKFTRGLEGALSSVTAIFQGLTSRLSAAIAGIRSAIAGVANLLRGIIEKSYGTLRANKPNTLGGNPPTAKNPSQAAKLIQNFEIAQQKIIEEEEKYYEARKAVRNAPSPENLEALKFAEISLASARKQAGSASIDYLKNVGTFILPDQLRATSTVSASADIVPRSSNNTGINAVGGSDKFGSTVNLAPGAGSNPVSSTLATIEGGAQVLTGQVEQVSTSIQNASSTVNSTAQNIQQTASLVSDATTAVTETVNAIAAFDPGTLLSNISSSVLGTIGSITTAMTTFAGGFSKRLTPIFAIGTTQSGSVTSTTSALLGSSIVPKINFDDTTFTADPNEYIENLNAIQTNIAALNFEKQKLILERNTKAAEIDPFTSSRADVQAIATLDKEIDSIEKQIQNKETQYVSALGGSANA